MVKYYASLIMEVPSAFRSAWESVLFWSLGFIWVVASINPTLWGHLPDDYQPSRELALRALLLVLLYGIARANHKRVVALRAELSKRDVEDTETIHQLKAFVATAQRLLKDRELIRHDTKAQDIWRNDYYDLKDQIKVVRISDGERFDLLSEFHEVSGNRFYDQMEDNVRRASPKLVALLLSYEKRATERPT